MDAIASFFDRRYRPHPSTFSELQDFGLLQWGRAKRFTGLVLGGDALVLDYKYFTSCRIRLSNLMNVPYPIYYSAPIEAPFSTEYISEYFRDNNDNPYAVWNCLLSYMATERPAKLTQFPPLHYPKDDFATSLDRVRDLALPADSLFTFDRSSGLSRLIRKFDRGMWSHVAMVSERKTLYESTTSGVVESDFSDLHSSLDVALYRIPDITQSQREKMTAWLKSQVGRKGYNWRGVIRIYLHGQWGIPVPKKADGIDAGGLDVRGTI